MEEVGRMQDLEEGLALEVLETSDILGQVNHKQGYSRAMGGEMPSKSSVECPNWNTGLGRGGGGLPPRPWRQAGDQIFQ